MAILGAVQEGMTVGKERDILWEHSAVGELLPLVVKLHHAALVYCQGRFDFHVLRQQPRPPVFVRQHYEAIDPGWPLAGHPRRFLGKTVFADSIGEIHTKDGIESTLAGEQ